MRPRIVLFHPIVGVTIRVRRVLLFRALVRALYRCAVRVREGDRWVPIRYTAASLHGGGHGFSIRVYPDTSGCESTTIRSRAADVRLGPGVFDIARSAPCSTRPIIPK